ncbi:MAG: hypothetical protein ABIQ51_06715 [Mesorhizobium sp.]
MMAPHHQGALDMSASLLALWKQ